MEELSARAVVGQRSKLRTRFATLARFHRRVWAAHLRFYPAGMRRVHLDLGVAQFMGEVNGERI
jgi:hypothetical protein